MSLLRAELRKVWAKRAVLLALLFLLLGNMFLMWVSTKPSASSAPPSAYRLLTQDLQPLTMPERVAYVEERYEFCKNMVIVEEILTWEAQDREMGKRLRSEYFELLEEYEALYWEGGFLRYTDTPQQEYRFLGAIKQEMETACGYEDFLAEIQQKAEQLSQISIFAQAGGYDQLNILATASAFQGMSGITINYYPQKGFYTAVNFQFTDVFAFFSMLVFASVLVRQEKDSNLLSLIRSTAAGRTKTAAAKLGALGGSMFIVLLLLYGGNFIYCASCFGMGSLTRSIQSLPFLMRSTLKINLLQYSALFFLTKWACSFVAGAWVLLATLCSKKALPGYLLSALLPALCFFVYWAIPATSKWNILKYANLVGLMQTNSILGRYYNLYCFGKPVALWVVSLVTAGSLVALFVVVFGLVFGRAELLPAPKHTFMGFLRFRKRKKHRFSHRLLAYEAYKTLLMNGAVWALGVLCVFQIVTTYQNPAFIPPKEIYYRYYMSHLEGPLTHDKYVWLSEEAEKFVPLYELEAKIARGEISLQEAQAYSSMYQGLIAEYEVYQQVMVQYNFVLENPPAQFVYDTGYPELFSLQNDVDMNEAALCILALVFCCCGIIATEKATGMAKAICCTPLGQGTTMRKKLLLVTLLSAAVAFISLVPKLYKAGFGYGFGGLLAPLFSLREYRSAPQFIPIIGLLLLAVLARFVACFGISVGVLCFSAKVGNSTIAMLAGLLVFGVPPLLYYVGVHAFKWLSAYPLFHMPALMAGSTTAIGGTLFLAAWLMWAWIGVQYLNKTWAARG